MPVKKHKPVSPGRRHLVSIGHTEGDDESSGKEPDRQW